MSAVHLPCQFVYSLYYFSCFLSPIFHSTTFGNIRLAPSDIFVLVGITILCIVVSSSCLGNKSETRALFECRVELLDIGLQQSVRP